MVGAGRVGGAISCPVGSTWASSSSVRFGGGGAAAAGVCGCLYEVE